ncbi:MULTISPECIES: hypothetical protein [unclassified Phaeobacter]|uniref:hypothetical protein n=1 Tax=unclassified Phaeobacter TaxID=2621772 RepID=UPI003A87672C
MADNEDGSERPKDGEILPEESPELPTDNANWLALISNYTERPDLFLAEVEKHDPGFIKRMNEDARQRSERNEAGRFFFGKHQAYATLSVMVLAAIVLLLLLGIAVWNGQGFWTIIALGVVYAITQGGTFGFYRVIDSLSQLIGKAPRDRD